MGEGKANQDLLWIRESNLIENINSHVEDERSLRAWNWLLKQEWGLDTCLRLHKKLMGKLNPRIAGKLRNCSVRIGDHIPPDWKESRGLIYGWFNKTQHHVHPKAIRQDHVDFETIHPFEDGNGRTGRMLMNWQRVMSGLKPLLIKASERNKYYDWFTR